MQALGNTSILTPSNFIFPWLNLLHLGKKSSTGVAGQLSIRSRSHLRLYSVGLGEGINGAAGISSKTVWGAAELAHKTET